MTILFLALTFVVSSLLTLYFVTPMSYLVVLFIASCLLSIFYWEIFQPVALRAVSFRLFAKRDELRRLAIDRQEDYKSPGYSEAEEFLCKTIAVVPAVNLISFICFLFRRNGMRASEKDGCQRSKVFSHQIEKLMSDASMDALLIMFINSPLVLFFSVVVYFALRTAGRINKLLIQREAEDFVYNLPLDLTGEPLPTRLLHAPL